MARSYQIIVCNKEKEMVMKIVHNVFVMVMGALLLVDCVLSESSTNMGRFILSVAQCKGSKTFVNNTKKSLVVKWKVTCPESDEIYVQSPLVLPGQSCKIDMTAALRFIQSKTDKKSDHFGLDLSLGVVTKAPIRPHTQFDYRALRGPEKGIFLTKNEFVRHSVFRLYEANNGQICYQ